MNFRATSGGDTQKPSSVINKLRLVLKYISWNIYCLVD